MPSISLVLVFTLWLSSYSISRWQQRSLRDVFLVICPICLAFLATWRILLWPFLLSPLRYLPEPKGGTWLNGHAEDLSDERSGQPMNQWINEIPNEGLVRYRVRFNRERLFVTNTKALSEVLVHKSYDFAKPRSLRLGLGRVLGIGLIVAEGEEHKAQRRQLMPAFAFRHVKDLYPVFWSKSIELANALSSLDIAPADRNAEVVVDISRWLSRATLDIIGVAGLGEDFRTIQDPEHEVVRAYSAVFDQRPPKSKIGLFLLLAKEILARMLPFKRHDTVAKAAERLKAVARRLIQHKRDELRVSKKVERKDILSVALESGVFTDEMIVNQLLTFLAAGHETTATSMTWALLALCRHQDVQTRLREEVRSSLPPSADIPFMTAEMLNRLSYLQAVCNEVFRLYPPAGLTKRVAVKDTSILGKCVPKGTDVVIVMRAINHSRELWGADAADFKPERWLKSSSGGAESNYSFCTFLHGPRSCIGQGFARAEFASLLAVLVGCFEMALEDEAVPVEIETGLTSRPKGGLGLKLKRLEGW